MSQYLLSILFGFRKEPLTFNKVQDALPHRNLPPIRTKFSLLESSHKGESKSGVSFIAAALVNFFLMIKILLSNNC